MDEWEGYRLPPQVRDTIERLVWLCLHDPNESPIAVVAVNANVRRDVAEWN